MFKPTNVLYPWLSLVSELIFYHRCKIYFNYQDEQLRGSAYYPSGPNPARRPLCAPCQYFQLSMALTFPVAGVLISSANCGATDRFPGPLNTSSLSPSQIFPQTHSLHQDLKIARCHHTGTILGHRGPACLANVNLHSSAHGHLSSQGNF